MKTQIINVTAWLFLCFLLNSCAAVEGIFKAGVWSGVLMVAVVVALIIFIIAKATKK